MRVALITGGGTGIGRAVAQALAVDDFHVILTGRRVQPLEEAVAKIENSSYFQLDVTDEHAVSALFDTVQATHGRLDLLFNNAGTGMAPAPIEDLDVAAWRAVIDTNLTGTFLCTQHAIRLMKTQRPQGGRIINNGSISAYVPRPLSAAYTASKHAITGLTRATSLEGRGFGIACGQIDIGNASTDMTGAMQHGVTQADGRVAPEPTIPVALVARSVAHMASLPLDANVQFMTVMATEMPFIGRG